MFPRFAKPWWGWILTPSALAIKISDIVNVMYRYGYCFHLYAYKTHMSPIAVPSPPLGDIVKTDFRESAIPLFGLMADKLQNAYHCGKGRTLYQFQEVRDRRFRDILREAEILVEAGCWDDAETLLVKLQSVKETAKMIGLLAQVKFRKGQKELAKEYCTRGIHKDPDYGPLYNQLACYWREEENYIEALKWFALAKQCVRYPQREEAYINSGYIYKKQGKHLLALEQFRIALDMVPFHSEIRREAEELERLASSAMNVAARMEKIADCSHGH